jgi:nicotinamidase-related amidase
MDLIDRDVSCLLVIDTQEGFYPDTRDDVDAALFSRFVDRAAWVTALAAALGVAVIVTEEDPARNGPTADRVARALPRPAVILEKPIFAAADNPPILAAIHATGAETVVLVGMETDVCVAQSAASLLRRGFRVVVVHDAVFSPKDAHQHGLRRLRSTAADLVSAKELYYDWVRTLASARSLLAANPQLASPPGFRL